MQLIFFNAAACFLDCAQPLLCQREAENNLILGHAARGVDQPQMAPQLMLTVLDGSGRPIAAATQTGPHNIVLTDMPADLVALIARGLKAQDVKLPGVFAPAAVAKQFLDEWRKLNPELRETRPSATFRAYQLDQVSSPASRAAGVLHPAREDDLDLLSRWCDDFARQINEPFPSPEACCEHARQRVAAGQMFIWKDATSQPVTMAAWAGRTPHGVRINSVFTPPEYRRRGYASACVAALSQHLLDSGLRFCFLYTDLANPTSNSIYQKIGYRPLGDWANYYFACP